MPDPRAQSLLVTFLKNLFDPFYVEKCESSYKFIPVTGALKEVALQGIDMLEVSPDAPTWTVEKSEVIVDGGMDDYVISTRRKRGAQIDRDFLMDHILKAEERIDELLVELSLVRGNVSASENATLDAVESLLDDNNGSSAFGQAEGKRLDSAFVMSIVSLSLCFGMGLFMIYQQRQLHFLKNDSNESSVLPEQAQVGGRRSKK